MWQRHRIANEVAAAHRVLLQVFYHPLDELCDLRVGRLDCPFQHDVASTRDGPERLQALHNDEIGRWGRAKGEG